MVMTHSILGQKAPTSLLLTKQVITEGAKKCDTIPSKADLLYCLEEPNLIPLLVVEISHIPQSS